MKQLSNYSDKNVQNYLVDYTKSQIQVNFIFKIT